MILENSSLVSGSDLITSKFFLRFSIQNNEVTTLDQIDKFVDGAAVKRVGDLNFEICTMYSLKKSK